MKTKTKKAKPAPPLLPVTVKRSKWARGNGSSCLLSFGNEGGMCCLGFVGLECGFRPSDIRNILTPVGTVFEAKTIKARKARVAKWPDGMFNTEMAGDVFSVHHTENCKEAMHVNDSPALTDTHREKKLTALGPKIGVAFTFVD